MKILGIAGSLRGDSHNVRLLRAAAETLPPGVTLELWDGLRDVPLYDEDVDGEGSPAGVRALREAIADADAVLISTPEYNASIPGVLKNALDWASRPYATNVLRGKPAAVVGASTGLFGAVWAQAETRKVLKTIGAHILEDELPLGLADDAWDPDGRLLDPELRDGSPTGRQPGPRGRRRRSRRPREGRMLTVAELPLADGGVARERADAARNRIKILEAAERLIEERGLANVSMDDVAREACVGKGTLYRRFGDRASLALALLDEHERDCRRRCCAASRRSARACRRASG